MNCRLALTIAFSVLRFKYKPRFEDQYIYLLNRCFGSYNNILLSQDIKAVFWMSYAEGEVQSTNSEKFSCLY